MLRENQYILRQVSIALDLLLVVAAFLAAFALQKVLSIYVLPGLAVADFRPHLWLLLVAPPVTVAAMAYHGLYQSHRLRTRTRELTRRLALACMEAMLMTMAIQTLMGVELYSSPEASTYNLFTAIGQTSRAILVLLPLVTFAFLLIKTWLVRRVLMSVRRRGFNYRRVVLVGSGEPLTEFARTVQSHPIWGLKIEGVVTDRPECQGAAFDPARVPEAADGLPIVADLEGAGQFLWRTPIDEVVFVPEAATLGQLRPLMELCEEMGVRTHLPLNFFKAAIARPLIDHFDTLPVLSYWPTRDIGPALLFKYAFDRLISPLLLLGALPVLAAATLAIRLSSRRGEPIFFRQTRCGLNGRLFTVYKFRTMSVDAEARRAELEAMNEQIGPVFKIEHDPRVTPVGRVLRKFSIDELPQLWNVVRGEMSLVGPRPPLPGEVAQYDRWQRRRLSMKPGITCLWQVMGRNRLPFDTWMKLDLQYIDEWSLALDFKILARTAWVVVTGYGAM